MNTQIEELINTLDPNKEFCFISKKWKDSKRNKRKDFIYDTIDCGTCKVCKRLSAIKKLKI